ncbi:MAG: hypothetical protein AABW63_00160 [Nanoarchaeota archaeon]
MPEKRGGFFICLIVSAVIIITLQNVSSLGLTPAIETYNFIPDSVETIHYNVLSAANMEVEVSAEGDLAQYISFDKTNLVGGGEFDATIKFPHVIEKPGRHRLGIVVGQKVDPELASGFIGTRVVVVGAIDVYVPYPGKYVEIGLTGHDANVGEPINFELSITSKGTEDVTITPKVEIYSGETQVKEFSFQKRLLRSQESIALQKQFDTSGLNSGNYTAVALVDYGDVAKDRFNFKIGNLSISIINYSNFIPISKLQSFDVEILSNWNNDIDGVFADVEILNNSVSLASFKTTSTSLTAWEKKTITGYLDTSNFSEGFYDANITLNYYGRDERGETNKIVKVQFYNRPSMLIWFIIGGIGVLIILTLAAVKFIRAIRYIKENGTLKRPRKK